MPANRGSWGINVSDRAALPPFRDVFAGWAAAWPVRGRRPGSLPRAIMAARQPGHRAAPGPTRQLPVINGAAHARTYVAACTVASPATLARRGAQIGLICRGGTRSWYEGNAPS